MKHRSDILFAAAVFLILATAWYVRDVLLLIYVAALFAVVTAPAVNLVRHFHIGRWQPSRGLAVIALLVALIIVLAALGILLLPPIVHDLQAFSQDLPNRARIWQERIQHLPFAKQFSVTDLQGYVAGAVGGFFGLFKGVAGGLAGFFSWVILTIYFALDGERAFQWSMSLFPSSQRDRLDSTLRRAEVRVSHWLLGQAMLMLILGVAASVTFKILGVKYALAIGVVSGLLNIVPIIGPFVSFVLAILVSATDSMTKVLGVVIFYVVYQQIEQAYLTPKIMKSTVDLPPLAVIIALALGGSIAGIIGALVAVPTAALVSVLVDEYLVHHSGQQAAEMKAD